MRTSFNYRNGQRATVKRPGTKEYKAAYNNWVDQFYRKKTSSGCLSCGSTSVVAKGGNGRLFVYCARCDKQLKVINTKPTKVGNWSKTRIYRWRAGLCPECGGGHFRGELHVKSGHAKLFVLDLRCTSCGHGVGWHE